MANIPPRPPIPPKPAQPEIDSGIKQVDSNLNSVIQTTQATQNTAQSKDETATQNVDTAQSQPQNRADTNLNKYAQTTQENPVNIQQTIKKTSPSGKSKLAFGIIMSLLLIFGLFIGCFAFKKNTYERETFTKGWLISSAILMSVGIVVCIILLVLFYINN